MKFDEAFKKKKKRFNWSKKYRLHILFYDDSAATVVDVNVETNVKGWEDDGW